MDSKNQGYLRFYVSALIRAIVLTVYGTSFAIMPDSGNMLNESVCQIPAQRSQLVPPFKLVIKLVLSP